MPRSKCDSDVTDVSAPPRGGTRKPARRPAGGPKRTGASPPDWPRRGDHVQCMWSDKSVIEGIVLEAEDRGWDPPSLWILTTEGERLSWKGRNVKIIARRVRRPTGKRKTARRARKRKA